MEQRIGLPTFFRGWGVLAGALSVAEGVCGGVVGDVWGWSGGDSAETSSITAFLVDRQRLPFVSRWCPIWNIWRVSGVLGKDQNMVVEDALILRRCVQIHGSVGWCPKGYVFLYSLDVDVCIMDVTWTLVSGAICRIISSLSFYNS